MTWQQAQVQLKDRSANVLIDDRFADILDSGLTIKMGE